MSEPVGVILAAGYATRMGRPKQLLPFGGSTVLGTVIEAALRSRLRRVVVVLGAYADEIRQVVDLSGVDVAVNPHPERGNLSSLHAAVGVVGESPVLLLMGDMPGMTADVINRHLETFAAEPAWLVSTTYQDKVGHPLMLSTELVAALGSAQGPKPLWQWVESERASTLHVAAPMPTDIDTLEDYGEARARNATE